MASPPRPYHVVLDEPAWRDLRDIFDYINSRAGPVVAGRFTTKLYEYCVGLSHTPERGTRRDELTPGLRTIGYRRRATIAFRVDQSERIVMILGIYYGGRNYVDDFSDPDG